MALISALIGMLIKQSKGRSGGEVSEFRTPSRNLEAAVPRKSLFVLHTTTVQQNLKLERMVSAPCWSEKEYLVLVKYLLLAI